MRGTLPEGVCPSGLCLPVRSDSVSRTIPPGGHEFPLIGPENAPNFDVFGHNPQRTLSHENLGRDFDSGAAHDFRRGLYRSGHDERSADRGQCELRPRFEAWAWGDDWNAFGRSSSQTDMSARRGSRISGRIAGLRGGDTPSRAGPNRQPAIIGSLALWRDEVPLDRFRASANPAHLPNSVFAAPDRRPPSMRMFGSPHPACGERSKPKASGEGAHPLLRAWREATHPNRLRESFARLAP